MASSMCSWGIQDKVVWDNIEYLIDSENNAMESESQEVHKDTRSIMWTLWITTFVSSIIGGLLAMIISRRISSGVRAVVARATAIAKGDLTGNDILIHSQDEVGILAQAMSTMQRSLRSIIGTVADTAGTLTASAVSMGASSEQITHRMDQQSQQTQQAAAALQEMSACIAEVSRHSQSAADTARSASKTAHEGGTIVKEMLASMHSIAGAVSETSTTISLLGEDSVHISHIVSVIEEIARKDQSAGAQRRH
jgi:methyl-accepting chemotaxis protein